MKRNGWLRPAAAAAAIAGLLLSVATHATDVANKPLRADVMAKPNVIFGMDDSGSMDYEVQLYTSDGVLWWNLPTKSGWGIDPAHPDAALRSTPQVWFNVSGTHGRDWRMFGYLFPNGTGPGNRTQRDPGALALPPTTQFAFLRSVDYNPLYYNPRITYQPWSPAYVSTGPVAPGNADPRRSRSHPIIPDTGAFTFDLTAPVGASTEENFVFSAVPGMKIPAGSQKSVCNAQNLDCGTWTGVLATEDVADGAVVRVAMSYFPATYWVKETCVVPSTPDMVRDDCATAPDGATLKRYEIKPGNTFPSGRAYAGELQNFANWHQYYRKRRLMLSAAVGQAVNGLSGMRLGTVFFNRLADVTMYDTDAVAANENGQRLAGMLYEANAAGGTPTRETLNFIGSQFDGRGRGDKPQIVQYACQRNNAFIVTDGFAFANAVPVPPWDSGKSSATYGSGAPYQRTYDSSLADLSLRYYTNRLRSDLVSGAVPETPGDANTDLHINTYALALRSRGLLYTAEDVAVPTRADAWPEPNMNRSPTAIDDLWHATINGRGRMYLADTPEETARRMRRGLIDMLEQVGAQSSVSVKSVNLRRGDARVYRGVYSTGGSTGDVAAYAIDRGDASVSSVPLWSAAALLGARDWTARTIASYDGSAGKPFTLAGVGDQVRGSNNTLFAYLRGDRTREADLYRTRNSLVGPIVNARPAVEAVDNVVYAASGEGMLHAFDADTGNELWAYVPYSVLSEIGSTAGRNWVSRNLLDGTPAIANVGTRRVLVGGRGTAGSGYYALDITTPRGLTDETLARRVLWEFPNADTREDIKSTVGLSVGRATVVRTRNHGTVVLLTSGYNNAARDGKGRLFMLDALSGRLLHTFVADSGAGGVDPGLAQVSVMGESNGYARYAYGGDELGNLWRFDLEEASAGQQVARVARLQDAARNPQPVTTAPELVRLGADRVVLVGTGRLLGWSDFGTTSVQSFYAIKDGSELDDVRSVLTPRTLTAPDAAGARTLAGNAFNWATGRGWYFDLPAGQKANTDPSVAFGAVAFTTNMADLVSCGAASYLYLANIENGLAVPDNDTVMTPLANKTVSGVVILRTDGSREGTLTVGDITTSDNRVINRNLNLPLSVPARKNGWRQIQRD